RVRRRDGRGRRGRRPGSGTPVRWRPGPTADRLPDVTALAGPVGHRTAGRRGVAVPGPGRLLGRDRRLGGRGVSGARGRVPGGGEREPETNRRAAPPYAALTPAQRRVLLDDLAALIR